MAKTKLLGEEALQNKLRTIARKFPDEVERALFIAAGEILTDSKENFVPVRLGTLRGTGIVLAPERKAGRLIEVTIAFGGPSAPYAIVQHENLDYVHRVGEAKYLERPLMNAVSGLAKRLAQIIDLSRAAS